MSISDFFGSLMCFLSTWPIPRGEAYLAAGTVQTCAAAVSFMLLFCCCCCNVFGRSKMFLYCNILGVLQSDGSFDNTYIQYIISYILLISYRKRMEGKSCRKSWKVFTCTANCAGIWYWDSSISNEVIQRGRLDMLPAYLIIPKDIILILAFTD